jgi:translation initiation factor RLI1
LVLLGENGMGKTTLVQLLGGKMEPDDPKDKIELRVSMKPQTSKYPASYLEESIVGKELTYSLPQIPRYR